MFSTHKTLRRIILEAGLLSVKDDNGEMFVLTVPANPKATAERALSEADPEYIAELRRRAVDPGDFMTVEEVLALRTCRD